MLPGTALAVSPLPDSYDASPRPRSACSERRRRDLGEVHVSGSQTGAHPGRLRGYSQGDGASFVPAEPFSPGEEVTVRGSVRTAARTTPFAYHFIVAKPGHDRARGPAPAAEQRLQRDAALSLASGPPAAGAAVSARSSATAPGDIFIAPYAGPGPSGPMIFDEAGNLIWFHPLPRGIESTNLQVQQYNGQPVLTWWQG